MRLNEKKHACRLAIISSCGIQSKTLVRSVNSAPKAPPFLHFFLFFSHSKQTILYTITLVKPQ